MTALNPYQDRSRYSAIDNWIVDYLLPVTPRLQNACFARFTSVQQVDSYNCSIFVLLFFECFVFKTSGLALHEAMSPAILNHPQSRFLAMNHISAFKNESDDDESAAGDEDERADEQDEQDDNSDAPSKIDSVEQDSAEQDGVEQDEATQNGATQDGVMQDAIVQAHVVPDADCAIDNELGTEDDTTRQQQSQRENGNAPREPEVLAPPSA